MWGLSKVERKRIDATVGFIACAVVFLSVAWIIWSAIPVAPAPAPVRDKIPCFVHPNIPNAKVCGLTVYHYQNGEWVYMGPLLPFDPAVPEAGRG